MNTFKLSALSALLLVGTSYSVGAQAEPLFQPLSKQSLKASESVAAKMSSPATESVVSFKANTALVNLSAKSLDINLASDLNLKVSRHSVHTNPQGSVVWKGAVTSANHQKMAVSDGLMDNSVILVKRDSGITGSVRVNGQLYSIRPLGNGAHAVYKINESKMPEDHPHGAMQTIEQSDALSYDDIQASVQNTVSTQAEIAATADIGILVGYTAAAKNAVSDIQGLIELAVAETNTGYSNSGVDATMTLVHTYQVNYTESNFSTDLSYFRNNNDGVMDEVHGKRDQYGADVAMIMTNVTDYCGLASGIGSTSSTAFAAVYHGCATGYYSFGHEVGHLQSARHDPNADPTSTPYAFGHGYQYAAGNWRTIMAYNCSGGCTRINWWSNPNKTRNGVAMGTSSTNDNARVLNITSPTIANFKGSGGGGGSDTALTNGQAQTGLGGSQGNEEFFYLDVPAGATNLSFVTSGGSGDADLYVKFGSKPTTSSYDCRPYRNGNAETCNISSAQEGRYWVMLRAYSTFSGVSLTGSFSEGGGNNGGSLTESNLSGSQSAWDRYSVVIPAGMSSFTITINGGSGDADLYVRKGSQPSTSSYDCRPYRNGNSETCTFNNPGADTWHIGLRGYRAYSGVTLNAQWQP
ncbi:pre-peptidase C-terminal domain-containing protein [Pleionea sp. CnH1-48]|uniref:pre-peptidase C-terminal domain-containing protein n=1 Tax=Pleionea sp. CnH1-48 TaxID=2954494 RepID=UPI00273A693E|nr:pre-peptidase C-terminal domain-containing protein [Pleionea sp. CnH1-48]